MEMKLRSLMVALLILFSSTAYALECDVEFRAKKISTDNNWYGDVEKPKFQTGVASGEGETRKLCADDVLNTLRQDGWEIKYWKIIKTY